MTNKGVFQLHTIHTLLTKAYVSLGVITRQNRGKDWVSIFSIYNIIYRYFYMIFSTPKLAYSLLCNACSVCNLIDQPDFPITIPEKDKQ